MAIPKTRFKDFPTIEEQLDRFYKGEPLPKANFPNIGDIGCLLTSVEFNKWQNQTKNPRVPRWKINYKTKWFYAEEYIAEIFKLIGFKKIWDNSGAFVWLMRRNYDYKRWDRKIDKFSSKTNKYNIWCADNDFLEKRFQKARQYVLSGCCTKDDWKYPKDLKEFVKVFPENKLKEYLRYTAFYKRKERIHAHGAPDLILYNYNQRRLLLCEAKSEGDRLGKWQSDFIKYNKKSDCLPLIIAIILKGGYPQWDLEGKNLEEHFKNIRLEEERKHCEEKEKRREEKRRLWEEKKKAWEEELKKKPILMQWWYKAKEMLDKKG